MTPNARDSGSRSDSGDRSGLPKTDKPTPFSLPIGDPERFLISQHEHLGDATRQMGTMTDRFASVFLALTVAVIGLSGRKVAPQALAAVPFAWSALTLVMLRVYKEVLAFGGLRRAIEGVLRERSIPLLDEHVVVKEVVRSKSTVIPYTSLIGLSAASSFVIGYINFDRFLSRQAAPGWPPVEWTSYIAVTVVLVGFLLWSTLSTLTSEEKAFNLCSQMLNDVGANGPSNEPHDQQGQHVQPPDDSPGGGS
jgi:hypothetical protein